MTVVTMASGTQFIVEETHAEAMQKLAAATNTGDLVVTMTVRNQDDQSGTLDVVLRLASVEAVCDVGLGDLRARR